MAEDVVTHNSTLIIIVPVSHDICTLGLEVELVSTLTDISSSDGTESCTPPSSLFRL